MAAIQQRDSRAHGASITTRSGQGSLTFRRSGAKTVLESAFAASPLRFLTPRNHGDGAWVFLSSFGGGLVDGDSICLQVDAGPDTCALIGTQACTKVYRSPRGCCQRLDAHAAEGALLAFLPDPVVCFAGARYRQDLDITLSRGASLLLVDGYTAGRAARGERWQFASFESRMIVQRDGAPSILDATRLDPAHGAISPRMGRFDVILSVIAAGPRLGPVRAALLEEPIGGAEFVVAASPIGADAVFARVAAERFEYASRPLRRSFQALAGVLGDDPLARKW